MRLWRIHIMSMKRSVMRMGRRDTMLKINGTEYDFVGRTVLDVITELGYEKTRIAVERNEEIVPKAAYESTVLADGDTVEVVSFVGGG